MSWRRGTKGRLAACFAVLRIRIVDGNPQRILDEGQQHMPGEEAWLVGEWRSSGERKYCLSNLPADTSVKALAAAIKARWVCEQAHQQMKEELGLDHFQGRSWAAPTRADDDCLRFPSASALATGKAEKKEEAGAASADLPAIRRAVIKALSPRPLSHDVRTSAFASGQGRIESAKVVLGRRRS